MIDESQPLQQEPYAGLQDYLRALPRGTMQVTLDFSGNREDYRAKSPSAAYQGRQWWQTPQRLSPGSAAQAWSEAEFVPTMVSPEVA